MLIFVAKSHNNAIRADPHHVADFSGRFKVVASTKLVANTTAGR
jgi:hypothetical protein